MDAERIDQLVLEACGLLHAVEEGAAGAVLIAELEHVCRALTDLAACVVDREPAEVARGVAAELAVALVQLEAAVPRHRGAA